MENEELIEEELEEEQDVILDFSIRRKNFWDYYLKPTSETYSNALQSALRAGYKRNSALTITNTPWFKKKLRHMNLYRNAEKVLDEALHVDHVDKEGRVDAATLRVKTDVAKHVTKNLGKDDGWTERTETTGKDGTPIVVMPAELVSKFGLENLGETKPSDVETEEDNNK